MSFTHAEVEQLIHLRSTGHTCKEIAMQLNKGTSTVARYCSFIKMHGADEFRDYMMNRSDREFSLRDYASVVEFMIENNCSIDRAAVAFKMPRTNLNRVLAERKRLGVPVLEDIKPAVLPEGVQLGKLYTYRRKKEEQPAKVNEPQNMKPHGYSPF